MKNRFYHYQEEVTLRNLDDENRRLRKELQEAREQTETHRSILDFHDNLERDFFSADSLQELIVKLVNRLHLRPEIDFVTLCLTRQYLEGMVEGPEYEHLIPEQGKPGELRYLSIIEEGDFALHMGPSPRTLVEKTPCGSKGIFFPDHEDEVRSHVIIPLLLRDRIIGSLNLGSIRSRHDYTSEPGPPLLDRLSSKLTIAIDNILSHKRLAFQKEILDRDIERAAILQKSLLPPPLLRNEILEISAHFYPCQGLGGDFYDLLVFSPERLAIVMADVAGHGISAALIAAMLKFSLQMDHLETYSPAEVLTKINKKFCQVFKQDDYITLCYGLLDLKGLSLKIARAGHPYPVLWRPPPYGLRELKPSGPPLGLDPEADYEEAAVDLTPGDTVFFYTDGLRDVLAAKEYPDDLPLFIDGLGEKFEDGYTMEGLQTDMDRLVEGRELDDDTSLLVLRLKKAQEEGFS